ncbi:MAG TPA: proteasome accessory factor PafA2 family protein [Nitrospiraceae bacterium]|nr:proteasome accessory factor PafA2 family protein [Nitrospiraceae bacterium]
MPLFGLETEYGITRDDLDSVDPVAESMELVRAHLTASFQRRWDYGGEDPHEDARGFRVSGLQQDKEEELFAQVDAHRPFSFHDMKSDLVLPNGARFYNDHTHPEYSTPECRTLRDLVAHDRAGERLLFRAAQRRNQALGGPHVQLYKNNTDFHGHSYGCHDNYLLPRTVPFETLVSGLIPFLVTRQVLAGAGKLGVEEQDRGLQPGLYQLSQRADFMATQLSVDTMHNRPILNTRDEPHADRRRYRRLHLIIGDANMCEYATALKVGTTRLVLDLIESAQAPAVALEDPVAAVKAISRDPSLKTLVRLENGRTISALDIQKVYCEAASHRLGVLGGDGDTEWILREWAEALRLLEEDRSQLIGRLDWVTKLWLLETFAESDQVRWDDPWLTSLDLEYHNLDPSRGLFLGLEAEGRTMRITTDEDIDQAIVAGPGDTRGGIRGLCVRRFPDHIKSVQWERISFNGGFFTRTLNMEDLFEPERVRALAGILSTAESPSEALDRWNNTKGR